MIMDRHGRLVWFHPVPKGQTAADLQVETYLGQPALVWWQGRVARGLGVGFGRDAVYSTSYKPLATIKRRQRLPGGPPRSPADAHGLGLHHGLHAGRRRPLLGGRETRRDPPGRDRAAGGRADGAGHVRVARLRPRGADGLLLQRPQIHPAPLGLLPRQLRSRWTPGATATSWSPHGTPGRPTRSTTSAARSCTGSAAATRPSKWAPAPGPPTSMTSAGRPDHTLTIFDNGATPKRHSQSRAIRERIDFAKRTVTLVSRFTGSDPVGQPGGQPGPAQRGLFRRLG